MKLILPLNIGSVASSLKLPLILFRFGKNGYIELAEFTIAEKEDIFGITDLKITENGSQFKPGPNNIGSILHQHSEKLRYKYKIVIAHDTDNPCELQKVQNYLDLILKIVVGQELSFAKIEDDKNKGSGYNNSTISSKSICNTKRITTRIDKKVLKRIKKLITIINRSSLPQKIKNLSFFLDTALQAPNLDIAGAFYITLLESLFAPDKDSEIAYRFSMRLTKMRNGDLKYRERIKKMYNYRSRVFHGNEGKFNSEDVKFVEEEATWGFERYIINPELFNSTNLDKKLLGV